MGKERLDKWIASQGGLSRRQVGELARAGRILVNGGRIRSADVKVDEEDAVVVDGRRILLQKHVYIMMNKPAGVVSASRDKRERTVLDLVPEGLWRPGLFPAGRLDKDTEGFLLITDDGEFAHNILSPSKHVPKTYYAKLNCAIDGEHLTRAFGEGVVLDGGDVCSPAGLTVLRTGAPAEVEVTIYEGMYHQIKRMFMRFGAAVTYLKRIRIGSLALDHSLAPGECRVMLHNEISQIW